MLFFLLCSVPSRRTISNWVMRIYGNLLEIQEMSVIDFGVSHVKGSKSSFFKKSIFSPFSSSECVNYWVICQGLDFVKTSWTQQTYCFKEKRVGVVGTAGVFVVFCFSAWQQLFFCDLFSKGHSFLLTILYYKSEHTWYWNSIEVLPWAQRWKCKSEL